MPAPHFQILSPSVQCSNCESSQCFWYSLEPYSVLVGKAGTLTTFSLAQPGARMCWRLSSWVGCKWTWSTVQRVACKETAMVPLMPEVGQGTMSLHGSLQTKSSFRLILMAPTRLYPPLPQLDFLQEACSIMGQSTHQNNMALNCGAATSWLPL